MAKYCGYCGAKMPDNAKVCGACGKPLSRKPQSPAEQNAAASLHSPCETAAENPKKGFPQKKRHYECASREKRHLWKGICILLLLALAAGAAALVLTYTGLADIPVARKLLAVSGLETKPVFTAQEMRECYVPDAENIVYANKEETYGYVNNVVLLFADRSMTEDRLQKLVQSIDGTLVGRIREVNQYQIQVDARDKAELDDLCELLMENEDVLYAMTDSVVSLSPQELQVPNDPWKDTFQGMGGVDWDEDDPDGLNWWLEATRVVSAWQYDDAFSRINVGIMDSGFDTNHEDLNIHVLNPEQNDPHNHGTHVAGIIGATINNGKGISGILNHAELYGVDVVPTRQQKKANIAMTSWADGLAECLDNSCRVVNMSLVTPYSNAEDTKQEAREKAREAVIYLSFFLGNRQDDDQDFIIVQAAGNGNSFEIGVDAKEYGGYFATIDDALIQSVFEEFKERGKQFTNPFTPQDIRDCYMVVGAVDTDLRNGTYHLATFSNYGDNITICAPGVDIFSTVVSGGMDGNYDKYYGTSMAAPIVSGIAAMTWSVNPSMSAGEVQKILRDTAIPVQRGLRMDTRTEYGMVDAKAAVEAAIALKDKAQGITVPMETDANDHHYQIFREMLSWQEAKEACEAMGGHLATITSADEQKVIEDLNVQEEDLWIGASRDESGAWAWVTGEPWSYTNWNEGEPNNSSNVAPNETCAAIWPKGWNDLANDNLYEQSGYICEWDGAQEPVVISSGRLKRGVYVSSQDPGNTLTIHQVDGNTATFTVFWPRIAAIDQAEATFQGTTGEFYYLDPSGGYHAAGQIVDHLDGTLVLTLTDSDLPYVPVGTAETYVLDETQAVEDWEPADSSNGILTEEQLENLKISLGVPEDMRVQYLQSDLSYWPSGRCWEVYVQILHEGNAIAMASVDPGSGEATRNILAYSGAEYPASISNPQPPASLIGDWKLDENEHSRVEYVDFKQNGEVTILYSTGEMETAPYRIESAGIVVTGQNTVHYYYMDGADLYLSEDLDRPALLYHLRE
jgi:hypothetical protein